MSRKGILFFAGCLTLLAVPALAGDTGINIIYPPPRDVAASDEAQPAAKAIKQTVTIAVITVTGGRPFGAGSWYQPRWDDRWTSSSRGNWRYYRPGYPF